MNRIGHEHYLSLHYNVSIAGATMRGKSAEEKLASSATSVN